MLASKHNYTKSNNNKTYDKLSQSCIIVNNVHDSPQSDQFHLSSHEKLESEIVGKRKNFTRG